MRPARIVTVGHSNRTLAEFVELLARNEVRTVADVRTLRASRAFPHFGEERLRRGLAKAGIGYVAIPELGGLRKKSAEPSPRPCWRNRGFRNYADYMRDDGFRDGVRKLLTE